MKDCHKTMQKCHKDIWAYAKVPQNQYKSFVFMMFLDIRQKKISTLVQSSSKNTKIACIKLNFISMIGYSGILWPKRVVTFDQRNEIISEPS